MLTSQRPGKRERGRGIELDTGGSCEAEFLPRLQDCPSDIGLSYMNWVRIGPRRSTLIIEKENFLWAQTDSHRASSFLVGELGWQGSHGTGVSSELSHGRESLDRKTRKRGTLSGVSTDTAVQSHAKRNQGQWNGKHMSWTQEPPCFRITVLISKVSIWEAYDLTVFNRLFFFFLASEISKPFPPCSSWHLRKTLLGDCGSDL